ncbi:extracellular catalytic domain type 1 short-chain-length polyhydroxyalkanoate depolymerase [Microbulbifer spongiae]|uniref:PHB depolymerase family esterase n=1 Tax=Microbulbifer spongiae TaxID=2944933 RepID=A0ABY9EA81_9GAMM|nr:PHB depolymerase family esterase [Microbulbifer sp. MI-G]WKD48275.1 PHB depolymerase family esterase [Microbulbifer sp. MI-G]
MFSEHPVKQLSIFLLSTLFTVFGSNPVMAGSWQQNVAIGGFERVHVFIPDSSSVIGNGKALLILLHGCSQSIDAFLTAKLEETAENHGMAIAVPDAANKAGFGCWSYWQGPRTRSHGDYANLISLATALSGEAAHNIDPSQVYIAGLSSGAVFANTAACIAPDIFAGFGASAGPSIGTSASGAIGNCERADVASRCRNYAGNYASHLDTQIASIGHGAEDTVVNACYNTQNANGMAKVYGVKQLRGSNLLSDAPGHTADEHVWQDGRVSMLWFHGLGHTWSGGVDASGAHVDSVSIDYANYLGDFFQRNNKRAKRTNAGHIDKTHIEPVEAKEMTEEGKGRVPDAEAVSANRERRVPQVSAEIAP